MNMQPDPDFPNLPYVSDAEYATWTNEQQQKRHAPRVKDVEHPVGVALVLRAELAQGGMARSVYPAAVRKREMGATLFQQQDGSFDRDAFGFGESVPPRFEFIRNLDIPCHNQIIIQG